MSVRHLSSLFTAAGAILMIDGTQYVVPTSHPNFAKIRDTLPTLSGNPSVQAIQDFIDLIDIRGAVRKWICNGQDFTLENDRVTLNGEAFSEAVTDKVLSMMEAGMHREALFAFLRKVRQNPSRVAQEELLLFCVANNFMIHEDGDILAYKSVRGDYTDIHSGKFLNAVGTTVEMPRHQVDDDRTRTCSAGLHFASFEYASTWAGEIDGVNRRLMVMKISPADVVSIPADYNNQKGRCSKYFVLSEITANGGPLPKQEVYTDADAGVTRKQAVEGRLKAIDAELVIVRERLSFGSRTAEGDLTDLLTEREALETELLSLDKSDSGPMVGAVGTP